jgi:hypothetical protein
MVRLHRRQRISSTRRNELAVQYLTIALYLAMVIHGYGMLLPIGWGAVVTFLYDFQTLIAGMLALGSVVALVAQLRDQQHQHEANLALALRPEIQSLELVMRRTSPGGEWGEAEMEALVGVPLLRFVRGVSEADVEFVRRNTHPDISDRLSKLRQLIVEYDAAIDELIGGKANEEQAKRLGNMLEAIHDDREILHLFAEGRKRLLEERYW